MTRSLTARGLTLSLALVCAVASFVALSGCSPLSRRIDPDVDDSLGGTGIDSGDLRTVAVRMAEGIIGIPEIANATSRPVIILEPVRNGSPFVIDTDIFTKRIRALLNENCRNKVQFAARERLEAILKERKSKRDGVFGSSGDKTLAGADYILTGEILSISKARDGKRSDYIQYAFQLIDAESSLIAWEGSYDQKKEGKKGTLYR